MNPNERDARMDELLQYRFGCHEDPAGLEARMKDDPEWMRLMGEADDAAALLEDAARAEGPGLPFDELADTPTNDLGRQDEETTARPIRWRRWLLVAAGLALIPVLGLVARAMFDAARVKYIEDQPHRLVLSGPSSLPDASPASFRIETWNTAGIPTPANLSWSLTDDTGTEILGDVVQSTGSFDLVLPPRLKSKGELTVESEDLGIFSTIQLTAGSDAPLAHLTADKPMYRPGETAYLRALILDRLSLKAREGTYRFRVVNTKGAIQQRSTLSLDHGVAAMRWAVPPGSSGGRYRFELRDDSDKVTVEKIEFVVRDYQPPTLAKEIELDRDSYAPGQEGAAALQVSRMSGGFAAGAKAIGKLVVDGNTLALDTLTLDEKGRGVLRFTIPKDVKRGDARIVAIVNDRGVTETGIEPFLVPTGRLFADFYPEGGDLIAGVENRVYVEVTDPMGRPADAAGDVLDEDGRTIASFETEHLGRGRFVFTPNKGTAYRVVVHPAGLSDGDPNARCEVDLPSAVEGVVIQSESDSYDAGEDLRFQVNTPGEGPWIVAAFCRGSLVANDTFVGAGKTDIQLPVPSEIAGVLRVTVFDRTLKPLAERLVHRSSGHDLLVDVAIDDPAISPGEHQRVTVRATDSTGKPVVAALGVTVTDQAVRELIQEPRIGISDQTWLVADIDGVELEKLPELLADDDEARRGIDLLLGTRGWRRFAWADPEATRAALRDNNTEIANNGAGAHRPIAEGEVDRLLVMEGVSTNPVVRDSDDRWSSALTSVREEARASRSQATTAVILALLLYGVIAMWMMIHAVARRLAPTIRFIPPITASIGTVAGSFLAQQMLMIPDGALDQAVTLEASYVETELADQAIPEGKFALGDLPAPDPAPAFLAVGHGPGGPPRNAGGPGVLVPGGGRGPGAPGGPAGPGAGGGGPMTGDPAGQGDKPVRGVAPDMDALFQLGYLGKNKEELAGRRDDQQFRRVYARALDLSKEEYAHRSVEAQGRRDFTETVYWRPLLITGVDGTASFEFDVADQVTTWSVLVDAHGAGAIGQASRGFVSRIPFHLEAAMPSELTVGDRIDLPIAAVSEDPSLTSAKLSATVTGPLEVIGDRTHEVAIENGGGRWLLPLTATTAGKTGRIEAVGDAKRFGDRVEHELRVVPRGFPRTERRSGRLHPVVDGPAAGGPIETTSFNLRLPETWHAGSLICELKVYPAPLASLRDGMAGMLRTPSGCFEQASSSNYPNIMALSFVDAAGGDDIAFLRKARDLLPVGYDKIVGYECGEKGYEWFGSNPGHEALSAYGLLEFYDMAKVFDGVDPKMVARTRSWLLGRRDGSGGFQRNQRALDSFGRAPAEVTDAYITYALAATETDTDTISKELDRAENRGLNSNDPYEVALAALALAHGDRDEAADKARERLKAWQGEDGSLQGTTSSITSSRGKNLSVETTGFAVQAWLMDGSDQEAADRAVEYLLSCRSGSGTFGATQATIIALQALSVHATATRRTGKPGTLIVRVNNAMNQDNEVIREDFAADARGPFRFPAIAEYLVPGDNQIEIELVGGNDFPFVMEAEYSTEQPADHPDGAVSIRTELGSAQVVEGETTPLIVKVSNRTGVGIPMTLARVGIPASLLADTRVLDDLKKAGRFDLWEISGRELTLYWRCLAPEETKEVTIDLIARIPGRTSGPASRSYLYYTDDEVRWAAPLTVEVTPR